MELYLEKYAEPSVALAAPLSRIGFWERAVVVPCYGEDEIVDDCLAALSRASARTLVILVVNGGPDAPADKLAANRRLLARLPGNALGDTARFHPYSDTLDLVTLDESFSGVGTARKHGCDLAVALSARRVLASEYVHTTDADARVDADYFDETPGVQVGGLGEDRVAALVHPFRHGEEPALTLYEIFLRYYVLGLRWAGSPYAFHTVGSTLSISLSAYADVRGFPRREAGEDFYLLNKLAKVGSIHEAKGGISLLPRPSDRVPFGTGRAMARIAEDTSRGEVYTMYDPRVFEALRSWISCLQTSARTGEAPDWDALPPELRETLDQLHARKAVRVALETRATPALRLRHLYEWFDGFRTLKLVHGLRDRGFSSLAWDTALAEAPFLSIT